MKINKTNWIFYALALCLSMVFLSDCTNTNVAALTTADAINITSSSATSGGTITSDGGASVIARGVCWSTTEYPKTSDNKTSDSKGVGDFTSSITGLTTNTIYYVRAYATNSQGTSYGNEVTFTTFQPSIPVITTIGATNISQSGATLGGNVTSDGGSAVTERGVCWNTTTVPTISNNKVTNGTGAGTYTCNLTSLQLGTTYYVRAYAINSLGIAYGNEVSFITTQPTLPVITTTAITNLTQTGATSGGNITSDGGLTVTERGVCWNTSTGPTTSNSKIANGTGTGSYTCDLTALVNGTTYYVRAYAINLLGTVYGNEVTFVTGKPSLPVITTTAATGITQTAATVGGNVTADGGASVTERGVCWNTSTAPTTANNKVTNGTGIGSYICALSTLTTATTYYARAYAINSVGTVYGNEVSFATTAVSANTGGTLTVTTSTSTAGGGYSPKNIIAIWIKTSSGTFVKSLLVYANTRKRDLTHWVANTAQNTVNAVTGATQPSYAIRTGTWDATNTSATVVANGDYILCMELCDGGLSYQEFPFTKGATAFTLTPANISSFSNISIVWSPK